MPKDRAAQRVRFFDQYRSYVINYNLGKDLVRRFIERQRRRRGQRGAPVAGVREAAVVAAAALHAPVTRAANRKEAEEIGMRSRRTARSVMST